MEHGVIPFLVALIALVSIFGGAVLGFLLQAWVPKAHLQADSKDSMKLGAGLIATMAALVLGLLVSSAKSAFDTVNAGIVQGSAKLILMDRALAHYGPETQPIRDILKSSTESLMVQLWPHEGKRSPDAAGTLTYAQNIEKLSEMVRFLAPQTESQRQLQIQALQISNDMQLMRWALIEQEQSTLPTPLLIVLLFWLAMLNLIYGLFAPRNHTVLILLFICALSVSGAIFLIFEMDRPLEGLIKVSSGPIRNAMLHLGQ